MRKFIIALFIMMSVPLFSIKAQELYDINTIRDLHLSFYDTNWEIILDSLKDIDSEDRVIANLTVDGIIYDSVGVRFKGNSSYNSTQNGDKRPFNIKLDFIRNQDLYGYTTLKLSNMFKDPTCIREVLSFEMLRTYTPASQANYVRLYIDSIQRGFYASTESVNNDFVSKHFGSSDNSFFKCDPVTITGTPEPTPAGCQQVQGIASPLIYMGDDTVCYKQSYDIKSDSLESWVRLKNLITLLNFSPDSVNQVLDVDRALWMLVFNNIFVNLDSYTGSGHNYYIYENDYRIFNTVTWDLNENFGVFSTGLTEQQMQTLSTQHGNNNPERPLIQKLMNNIDFRKRYYAHYRTMFNEQVVNDNYKNRAEELRTMIDSYVQNDPNLLYTYTDFLNGMDQNTGGGPQGILGVNVLMNERKIHLSNHPVLNRETPVIAIPQHSPSTITTNDTIWIASDISNANFAWLHYKTNMFAPFTKVEMHDDGAHNDGNAGDGNFGAFIPPQPPATIVYYYIYADNPDAGKFSPERAEYEFYNISVEGVTVNTSDLVINELLASNSNVQADELNEFDDWVELYNNTGSDIKLNGMFLSDNILSPYKWSFPDTIISANDFLIIWTDNDEQQIGLHSSFKLSSAGEELYLFNSDGSIIDSVIFGAQPTDTTWGRYPNGSGEFQFLIPTFAATNQPLGINEALGTESLLIYPNPANEKLHIELPEPQDGTIILYNMMQQRIAEYNLEKNKRQYTIATSNFADGIYFISVANKTAKIIVNH